MDWVWRLGWFGLIKFGDLNSLSLSLGVNCPLLPVVQASPSSQICLVLEKMKLKFGSLITYSSQQANWFDFCLVPD